MKAFICTALFTQIILQPTFLFLGIFLWDGRLLEREAGQQPLVLGPELTNLREQILDFASPRILHQLQVLSSRQEGKHQHRGVFMYEKV